MSSAEQPPHQPTSKELLSPAEQLAQLEHEKEMLKQFYETRLADIQSKIDALAVPLPVAETGTPRDLWASAEKLFRQVQLAELTQENFAKALEDMKQEIFTAGSYAQRPDLLRENLEAQDIAGVLRLASRKWSNSTDRIGIPPLYKEAFATFVAESGTPEQGFELIWGNDKDFVRDTQHEVSRVEGVRHEVISGTRYPGLKSGMNVFMRAKVAVG